MTVKWYKTINLSLKWADEWNNENVHELGKWVAEKVKSAIKDYEDYDKYGFELEEMIENFENICTLESAEEINKDNRAHHEQRIAEGYESFHYDIVPLEEFDECTRTLYDLGDRYRWWIETK
ncbi:hypothetical protein NVP1121O_023 [Vibrio phage 1.121.O._10N.286.46.C4]|nr:hypothetical protein NVP1121O_023 [Vibrio phage 1.121.O._10N.286.46.C4]